MASNSPEYQQEFYISANGIARDVITSDICRFLGNNAHIVAPMYDEQDNRTIIGYRYKGYRAFTDEMVRSMQENTVQWAREKENNRQRTGHSGSYETSRSRQQIPQPYEPHPRHILPTHETDYTLITAPAQPNPLPASGVSRERFVQWHGRIYDNLTQQYVPVAQPTMETPRTMPPVPPAAPAVPLVPAAPDEYWTVDPASGRRCYVRGGRIVQYA